MLIVRPSVKETISGLYNAAGISFPFTGKSKIVPLRHLVNTLGLECVELPNLTARTAIEFLSRYGSTTTPGGDVDESPLAGYLYITANFGCIFVNQSDRVTRRRFSIAHELGHYLLHFRPLLDALKRGGGLAAFYHSDHKKKTAESEDSDEEDSFFEGRTTAFGESNIEDFLPPSEQMEKEADFFAGELLLPAEIVRAQTVELDLPPDDLPWRMATIFLVSRSAMHRRLLELDLLS